MTRSIRALGLCLLALGLVGAGSAQGAVWMVNGANLTSGNEQLKGFLPATSIVHTKIGGNEVLFECNSASLINANVEKEGLVSASGIGFKVKFQECITKINGTTNTGCEPNNNGTEPGVIVPNERKGRLLLGGGGQGVVLIESLVRETVGGVPNTPVFARVKMSVSCPIGSNIPIIGGQIYARDVGGNIGLEEEKLTHEFEEGPSTELWALSKTAEHVISLLRTMKVSLVSDKNWSGLPE